MPTVRILGLVILLLSTAPAGEAQHSALWGIDGAAWTAASRLPGFAWSGYRCGREAIPTYPVGTDVKAHGAKGDGVSDDSAAFNAALKATRDGSAVLVPAGRYVLTDVVEITRSHVVLRGEGPDRSILVMPRPLSEIHPRDNVDVAKTAYSFSGGFVVMQGTDHGRQVGEVAAAAKRGETVLTLSATTGLKAGSWVRLIMHDPDDHTLLKHIHGDLVEPGKDTLKHRNPVNWAAQVTAVDGPRLTLDRPLRLDVRPAWKPVVMAMEPSLTGSGIENLGFEFPGVPKRPHLQEAGYNTIQVSGAVDCWVRNVTATDADNGVIMGGSRFCTVDNFTSRTVKRTGKATGHHALWATGGTQDCLFIHFRCDTTYVHDLTVEGFACGNVFTKGSGVSINCDHHRNGPYENLFTDFDAGDPRRLFQSSGREDRGPHSGARTTFWGIHGQGTFPAMPPAAHWPLINLIGFGSYRPAHADDGPWIESCGGAVTPANLWEAQKRRL